MRLITALLRRRALRPIALVVLLLASGQSGAADVPDDFYRAEFVILERIVDPADIAEQMAGREVPATPDTSETLMAVSQDGQARSTLKLVPANELSLNAAAQRLEASGRYRVLMRAGWYQAFPPDYQGAPLRVSVGPWLDGLNQRAVEGTITIDRKRYLHVDVNLNHWTVDDAPSLSDGIYQAPQRKLVTWIHENRRMRSEEIHFLDSPTIGVLIFFKKVGED